MSKVTKITISLPHDLVALADNIASEKKINRSQVISECLRDIAEKRKNEILKQGYLAMAEEHTKSAEYFRGAQFEILPAVKNTDE
jgi:metal-responsive CopG/Arc/MetJ family transcriptional regulator